MSAFFRLPDGREANLYTLQAGDGFRVEISDFGGTVCRLLAPDRAGRPTDVVLGFAEPAEYFRNEPYFGAMIGRVANRVRDGRFQLDGTEYELIRNDRGNSLHGGAGFSHRLWRMTECTAGELLLELPSPAGEAGYPGNLKVTTRFRATADHSLEIESRAVTDLPTVLAMTNHSYFNLNGEASGTLDDQELMLHADCRQEVDAALIPTGRLLDLAGTAFDLSSFRSFRDIYAAIGRGLDDSFVDRRHPAGKLLPLARARSQRTGITLTAASTDPAVQIYSAGALHSPAPGKSGRPYPPDSAFCLECQMPYGAVNFPQFPSIRLEPGREYRQKIVYTFGLE